MAEDDIKQEEFPTREEYFSLPFGKYPLYVTLVTDGYSIDAESLDNAEACGIPASFTHEQVEIMAARAVAHGYSLEGL